MKTADREQIRDPAYRKRPISFNLGGTLLGVPFLQRVISYASAGKADMNDDDELKRCQAEIRRLKAENQDLRMASETFGHLAERLNRELRAERRLRTTDRRQTPRDAPDRRAR